MKRDPSYGKKPYGTSDMHGYLGNEGPTKDSVYNRYAIVAWPEVDRLENMLNFINVEEVFRVLRHQSSLDMATLRKFMEIASVKVARIVEIASMKVAEKIKNESQKTKARLNKHPNPVSCCFGRSLCKFAMEFDDPTLVNLFFGGFFKYMRTKASGIRSIATILEKFEWIDVGEALLDALTTPVTASSLLPRPREDDIDLMEVALKVAKELERGDAQQALLKLAVEKAQKLDGEILGSSESVEILWELVLHNDDDNLLEDLCGKVKRLSPRLLQSTINAFSDLWRDTSVSDVKKAVMVSIAAYRSEWLTSQIRVLGQPFTWETPVAEFPDNAHVEAFLRGSELTMSTTGILTFSNRYVAELWIRETQVNTSYLMKAGGTGSDAFVTITKTQTWYDESMGNLPQLKGELESLTTATVETLVAVVSQSRKKCK